MELIEWTAEFTVGIDEIDEQHRELVAMINALNADTHGEPDPARLRDLLARLNDYVRVHFSAEERLMGGGGCSPDLIARHFSEHAYFRGLLKDLTADFERGRRDVSAPLVEHLVHWFLHHIVEVDRATVHELKTHGGELPARVAAALRHDMRGGLSDGERCLLTQLRRNNEEIDRQSCRHVAALEERNRKLEADVSELADRVRQLTALLAAPTGAQS